MIGLPFLAVKLFFTRPRLLALGVFPGIFTFAAAGFAAYGAWSVFLQGMALLFSVPLMMAVFFLCWVLVGNLSLLPVEDAIVDECQQALFGGVPLPSPPFSLRRLAREAAFSLLLLLLALTLLLIALIPPLALVEFVLASWLAAYGFLATIYARRVASVSGRVTVFFEHPVSNFLLGALLNFLLFVPVVNVFLLGFAQVLAALVYFRREEAQLRSSAPRTSHR